MTAAVVPVREAPSAGPVTKPTALICLSPESISSVGYRFYDYVAEAPPEATVEDLYDAAFWARIPARDDQRPGPGPGDSIRILGKHVAGWAMVRANDRVRGLHVAWLVPPLALEPLPVVASLPPLPPGLSWEEEPVSGRFRVVRGAIPLTQWDINAERVRTEALEHASVRQAR